MSFVFIAYQAYMAQREIKEGWWTVKWPDQDGYDLVEFVRIAEGAGLATWGYRHNGTEKPIPLSSMIADGASINGTPTHVVNDIQQSIQETKSFGSTPFYRGHRRYDWELIPAVFRRNCKGDELSMMNNFRGSAPVRYANSPDEQDCCRWLSLAQHYGLPTRLLDWTLSPLVAAYFATEPDAVDDEYPGRIWVLNASKLNEMTSTSPGLLLTFSMQNKEVEELVKPAFDDDFASPGKVIAVLPPEHDMRHFSQQSVFTLHGDGKSLEDWRAELIPNEAEHRKLMMCTALPPKAKTEIRGDLERLGIHEASLFPDLANLARYIARDKRHRKRSSSNK